MDFTQVVSFPGLGLQFNINRIAFYIGDFPVYWYGVLIGTGLLLSMVYALSRGKEFGIDSDRMSDVILVGAIAGVIGARLYYVIFAAPGEFNSLADILDLRKGGVAFYGTIIAAVIASVIICPLRKVKFLPLLDVAATGFLLGQGIGRWGNFMNQEAFGVNTDLPWGMTSGTIQYYLTSNAASLAEKGIIVDPALPVHPTFLYESVCCLLGFAIFAFYTKYRKFDGQLGLMYLVLNGAERFITEGLRTDSLYWGTIRISKLFAGIMAVVSALILVIVLIKIKKKRESDSEYLIPWGHTDAAEIFLKEMAESRLKKPRREPVPVPSHAPSIVLAGAAVKAAPVPVETFKTVAEEPVTEIPVEIPAEEPAAEAIKEPVIELVPETEAAEEVIPEAEVQADTVPAEPEATGESAAEAEPETKPKKTAEPSAKPVPVPGGQTVVKKKRKRKKKPQSQTNVPAAAAAVAAVSAAANVASGIAAAPANSAKPEKETKPAGEAKPAGEKSNKQPASKQGQQSGSGSKQSGSGKQPGGQKKNEAGKTQSNTAKSPNTKKDQTVKNDNSGTGKNAQNTVKNQYNAPKKEQPASGGKNQNNGPKNPPKNNAPKTGSQTNNVQSDKSRNSSKKTEPKKDTVQAPFADNVKPAQPVHNEAGKVTENIDDIFKSLHSSPEDLSRYDSMSTDDLLSKKRVYRAEKPEEEKVPKKNVYHSKKKS